MSFIQVSEVNVYPVKSIEGISLSQGWVEKQGLTFDRRFMLAVSDGQMVTARTFPQLLQVRSVLMPDGLRFTAKGMPPLYLRYRDFKLQDVSTVVWKDKFTAYTTTDEADDWFSHIIGQHVELLYTGEKSNRFREKIGHEVSFADGYPLLLLSEASLDELNRRSSEVHQMSQFRANLVVSGTEPFAEDGWKIIRIGEVEFEIIKPCERCMMVTIDPATGKPHPDKEPLKTLAQFRANESGGIFFGQNLVARNEGVIRVGDSVEILSCQDKIVYPENNVSRQMATAQQDNVFSDSADATKSLSICINHQKIAGNNQDTLLEQAEKQGVYIQNSCRAGLCGACMVRIEQGKVRQEITPAIDAQTIEQGMALACCCIPETDIDVNF